MPAAAQNDAYVFEDITFTRENPSEGGAFGYSLDTDGEYVVVGAPGATVDGVNHGLAYLFDATTGEQLHVFSHESGDSTDDFGYRVQIEGGRVGIGMWDASNESGSVCLYDLHTRSLLYQTPPVSLSNSPSVLDSLLSFSMSNDRLVTATRTGSSTPIVTLLNAVDGSLVADLADTQYSVTYGFGTEVNDRFVVVPDRIANTVHIFRAADGGRLGMIRPDEPGHEQFFGTWISLDGDMLLIGSQDRDGELYDLRTLERANSIPSTYHEAVLKSNFAFEEQRTRNSHIFVYDLRRPGSTRVAELRRRGLPYGGNILLSTHGSCIVSANEGMVTVHSVSAVCLADWRQPWGVLDTVDAGAFLAGYFDRNPRSDLAEPYDAWNIFDIAEYIRLYNAGCQ